MSIKQSIGVFGIVLAFGAWSCNSGGDKSPQLDSIDKASQQARTALQVSDTAAASDGLCFAYQQNGDTIAVHLVIADDGSVEGQMLSQLKEKDRNSGTLQGKETAGLIIADYTFKSEGSTSVREVAFKRTERSLTEGFGDIDMASGHQKFKNPKDLDFTHSLQLTKVDCATVQLP